MRQNAYILLGSHGSGRRQALASWTERQVSAG